MNENEKELNKKILKIVIGVIIVFPGFPLFYFGLLFAGLWSAGHTYHVMEDCTSAQSKEIVELMELDPPHDLDVVHVRGQGIFFDDEWNHLFVKVSSADENTLGEYKDYIDDKNKKDSPENKHYVSEATIEGDTLSFTYTYRRRGDGDPCPAERYVCEHGVQKLILSD